MSNQTVSIINKATTVKDKYNIITFPTHERFESDLCKTGHNFYAFVGKDMKTWDSAYAEAPSNYYIFPKDSVLQGIDYDFILANSKFGHLQTARNIASIWKIPIISMECTVPTPNMTNAHVNGMRELTGDFNVFLTEYSKNAWNIQQDSVVIPHGIDTEVFKPNDEIEKKPQVLSVVNDYINRDFCCNYSGWKRITEGLNVRLVGKTEGLSEPAKSTDDLVNEYCSAQVFLNTSTISPVPTSLLEAMSCGCAVVTTATCMIPEIIENLVNGFMSNDENELKQFIEQLLGDEDLRNKMGEAARQTTLDQFSEEKFINNWNTIFDKACEVQK